MSGQVGLVVEAGLGRHLRRWDPVMVIGGDGAALTRAFHRALDRGLAVAVHTDDLFATGNDVDNRAAVRAVATDDLVLAGFAVAGPARTVDKLRLHP
jgi:hypothetical protein